jgi:hypothetical protein
MKYNKLTPGAKRYYNYMTKNVSQNRPMRSGAFDPVDQLMAIQLLEAEEKAKYTKIRTTLLSVMKNLPVDMRKKIVHNLNKMA